jgi:hypothetical protein
VKFMLVWWVTLFMLKCMLTMPAQRRGFEAT